MILESADVSSILKPRLESAGCAAYMAPERIDPPNPSRPDYDIRADVWSLGITLVELATGQFPYKDCKTDFEVLTKVLQDDPPLLPRNGGFSMEFRSFVKDCLMKNYKDRPKYKKLLTHPFILKFEKTDVDVGAWYRSSTEALNDDHHTTKPSSSSTSDIEPSLPFKPQPSPRVTRSRRPPQSPSSTSSSNYPSAISRLVSEQQASSQLPSSSVASSSYRSNHINSHHIQPTERGERSGGGGGSGGGATSSGGRDFYYGGSPNLGRKILLRPPKISSIKQ